MGVKKLHGHMGIMGLKPYFLHGRMGVETKQLRVGACVFSRNCYMWVFVFMGAVFR